MKKLLFFFLLFLRITILFGQAQPDTIGIKQNEGAAADDPSRFFTRIELFNELQHYPGDIYLNQTVLRINVKLWKKFTSRLDVPLVYNSNSSDAGFNNFGLGDISFRLLGYRFLQTKKSALTASIEIALNTAQSPLLGTGKNMFIPMLTYSALLKKQKMIIALLFQYAQSFGGYSDREKLSYSKLQAILIKLWTKNMWTVFAPEVFIDYVHGGLSMNLEGRFAYAPTRIINLWTQVGVGVFGDFIARYQWSAEVGCRFFVFRNTSSRKENNG